MNYKLGGSFAGNVNMVLREEKGYTYGARTSFSGNKNYGTFTASSSVRTNTTYESVKIFKDEIEKYREGISEDASGGSGYIRGEPTPGSGSEFAGSPRFAYALPRHPVLSAG